MPGRGGRRNDHVDEDSRPLLVSSREDLSTTLTPSASSDNVLFSIEGDQDEYETSALEDTPRRNKADQTVRFEEQVHVIAPPLRSTTESREAGMYYMVIGFLFSGSRVCLCIVDVGQLLRGCSYNLYRIRPRL